MAASGSSVSGWAYLPGDLLSLILDGLVFLPDKIRFSAVCKSWNSVAVQYKRNRRDKISRGFVDEPPMLLIPADDASAEHCNLYSFWEHKVYDCQLQIPCYERCRGSCYGWLAIADHSSAIRLVNPFSGKTIHLPPIINGPAYEFAGEILTKKVILSNDPSLHPDTYMVAVTHQLVSGVAFIRSGEQSWNELYLGPSRIEDILFCDGVLYAVKELDMLVTIDFRDEENSGSTHDLYANDPVMRYALVRFPFGREIKDFTSYYLVQSSEGAVLLVRNCPDYFDVYELKMSSEEDEHMEWVEIQSLSDDDETVLLVVDHTICMSASRFPIFLPNSEDYADVIFQRNADLYDSVLLGAFKLEKKNFDKHCSLVPVKTNMPVAAWIVPTWL